jgi:CO/xanthine dehydrogenase FAD-binding subunit
MVCEEIMIQPYPCYPEFEYVKPLSLMEAVEFLKDHADQSRLFAGGTDCFVLLRDRRIRPKYFLDLKSVAGLDQITYDPVEGLTIGAAVSLNRIIQDKKILEEYPILVNAARQMGSYQLRSRATLVGNLCNASPCGDIIGPSLIYEGVLHLISSYGERDVELSRFFHGPGKTDLKPGEIAVSITLPVPPPNYTGIYLSIGRNKLGDLAIAAVTVLGYINPETPSGFQFRIALSAVAPTVIFAEQAQKIMAEHHINLAVIEEAAQAAAECCSPIDDVRSSADYRRAMIRVLTGRALRATCEQLQIPL